MSWQLVFISGEMDFHVDRRVWECGVAEIEDPQFSIRLGEIGDTGPRQDGHVVHPFVTRHLAILAGAQAR